jgi:hypothetical protein
MTANLATPKYLTPKDVASQEHLSLERLMCLESRIGAVDGAVFPRPVASFIDLMDWTQFHFTEFLKDQENLNKFVHNRIIIDGQFLSFCQERKITVECLYKDSVISWKTDSDTEKFFVQGVFLIKSKEVEFLHSALFMKGNQNEDEVSFFVICSNSNYEAYLKLRNEFDAWAQMRDRSSLHIRVIDGEDLPYTKDATWEDLFLPPDLKLEIKSMVENFLSSKDFYAEKKIPWKRGLLLWGNPGCGKSSLIRTIMSAYNFKPITIASGSDDNAVREAFAYAEEQSPSLLYFEDLDSMLERNNDISNFLNLMDGISAKNGLFVIATANEVKKLKSNITDRPSRFDRKFEIPLPTVDMANKYLKRWFGKLLTAKRSKELAKYAVKGRFSYAYLKELYISAMFEALANNRKEPTEADIVVALERLIKDKQMLNNGGMNTDKYFDR